MSSLLDSSEMREAAALLGEIVETAGPFTAKRSREVRLAQALEHSCRRGRLRWAAVVDGQGLVLSIHGTDRSPEALGALSVLLGDAHQRASMLLGDETSSCVSFELGAEERFVLRRFTAASATFYFMCVCERGANLSGELALVADDLTRIVAAEPPGRVARGAP